MRKITKALAWFFAVIMLFGCLSAVSFAATKNPAATKKIAYSVTPTTVKLKWSKVSGATGYRVFQSVDGKWKQIKGSTTENTYTVKNLKPATSYRFTVKTYKKAGGKTYWSSYAKSIKVKTAALQNPEIFRSISHENCKIELRWSKVANAAGYAVYMYKDGAWQKIKATTGKSYTVTNLDQNTEYKFKVKAYVKVSGNYYYSSGKNLNAKTGALSVGRVTDVFALPEASSVTFNWSGEGNISGYRIYTYTPENGFKKLVNTSKNSYTVSGLLNNTAYTYSVRPFARSGNTIVWGENIKITFNTTLPVPSAMSAKVTDGEAEVIWSLVNGADGYAVYHYDEVTETYKEVVPSTESNIYNVKVPEGKMLRLAVRAFAKSADGSSTVWSGYKYFTLGGTQKYQKVFASGEYSFTSEIEEQLMTVFIKDGSCQLRMDMPVSDKMNAVCKIIYNKNSGKTIAVIEIDGWDPIYCSDVKKLIGEDIDMAEAMNFSNRFVNDEIMTDIVVSEYNEGKNTLIRESFVNQNGDTVAFYFKDGEFVRHEIISNKKIDRIEISNVKERVDDETVSTEIPWWWIDIGIFLPQ